MPVTTTYPGVYVQEVPSGVRTIAGVSTSVAMFIGRAKTGPMKEPVLCLNFSDFERTFSSTYAYSDLARAVRLFFTNGGTQCYVMRIAYNAVASQMTLKSEAGSPVLNVEAKSAGVIGDTIRMAVSYNTQYPEATFNLEVFRWAKQGDQMVKTDAETFTALTMEPSTSRYAPDYVTQNSNLIKLTDVNAGTPIGGSGYAQSGRPLPYKPAGECITACQTLFNPAAPTPTTCFKITVDGNPANIDLGPINFAGITEAQLKTAIADRINSQLSGGSAVTVTLEFGPDGKTGTTSENTRYLRISSANGDVRIQPAQTNDLARALMLGTAQGGIELGRYSVRRPAPTGVVLKDVNPTAVTFAGALQPASSSILIDAKNIDMATGALNTVPTDKMYKDILSTANANCDGVREKLNLIATAVNAKKAVDPTFTWSAELWGSRLAFISAAGGDNTSGILTSTNLGAFDTTGVGFFRGNVRFYSLGMAGTGSYQVPVAPGSDGTAPKLSDYRDAFDVIDKEVDLFNLMILPQDADHTAATIASLWGPASVFCQKRRAFLIMDAPSVAGSEWKTVQNAIDLSKGVNSLRVGLVKDFSAIFYPRLVLNEDGISVKVGASGAIAGLMARVDGTRGVWKAPAGTEADLRGITGLEYKFSDGENGVLNPRAINTLRVFPNGIVNWGARTMDGDDDFGSEYKYIPIRRLALYMEESLYRGLKWVVFEPNDEPLWSQIRLNVGAFMHNLFRQGAFQGQTPKDAYFVKCDAETTTQNDRNLGRVNIWVGFAPVKPAEFVVLYLQQIAGKIQS